MKLLHPISTLLFIFLVSTLTAHAQIGIGTTTPDPSAALDIESTTQGVLIPRMLKAQRELIGGGSPAAGMLVYQTDDVAGFYFYNGTAWVSLTTVKPSGLETVDEGNGNGLVRVGRNPNNYGNIGSNAVDLSFSDALSTTYGATGFVSTAMGDNTQASGDFSTALGHNTKASGNYSLATGRSTIASGFHSVAMGFGTLSSGYNSTALGGFNEASGESSTALGQGNDAIGNGSTATGVFTQALGSSSTTMGSGTLASGQASLATGWNTEATGNYSTSMGFLTRNTIYANLAIGRYNDGFGNPTSWVSTDPVFEIGIGTSDFNRINAMTVLKNGNVGIGTTDPSQALSVIGNAEVTGNLGIGTPSPTAKLDVNGNAHVNGNIGIGATNPSDKLVIEGGRLEVLADIDASSSPGTGSIEVANSLRIDANEIITNFSSTLYLQQGNNGNLVVDGNTIFVDALNNRVGIGTSSPSKTLDVRGQIIAVSDNSPALIVTGSSNSPAGDNGIISSNPSYPGSDLFLRSNDEVVVQIDFDNNESGNFQVENSSGTNLFIVNESGDATLSGTLTENSDRRLKKNIETIPYGLTEILQLQPKAYNWKAKDQEHKSLGLIAQEVQEVLENVIRVADDEDKTLSLSYTSLVPVLIKAIQEQQAIIDEQADKIKALEKQNQILKELEARLEKLEAKTFQ